MRSQTVIRSAANSKGGGQSENQNDARAAWNLALSPCQSEIFQHGSFGAH